MLYGREIIHNVQLSILNVRLCKTPFPDGLHHFYQCNPINFAREKFPGEIIRKIIHWKAGKSWYFYNGRIDGRLIPTIHCLKKEKHSK